MSVIGMSTTWLERKFERSSVMRAKKAWVCWHEIVRIFVPINSNGRAYPNSRGCRYCYTAGCKGSNVMVPHVYSADEPVIAAELSCVDRVVRGIWKVKMLLFFSLLIFFSSFFFFPTLVQRIVMKARWVDGLHPHTSSASHFIGVRLLATSTHGEFLSKIGTTP